MESKKGKKPVVYKTADGEVIPHFDEAANILLDNTNRKFTDPGRNEDITAQYVLEEHATSINDHSTRLFKAEQDIVALKKAGPQDPDDPPSDETIQKLDGRITNLEGDVRTINDTLRLLNYEAASLPMGMGTFQQAFDKAIEILDDSEQTNKLFPWILYDTDDDGDTVRKVIYHIGNRQFIDALGCDIEGNLSGLSITVTEACTIKVNNSDVALVKGRNNISTFSDGQNVSFNGNADKIINIDFGGLNPGSIYLRGCTNLRSVRGMKLAGAACYQVFGQPDRVDLSLVQLVSAEVIAGTGLSNYLETACYDMFANCRSLRHLDLSRAYLRPTIARSAFFRCGATVYDLRTFDMRAVNGDSRNPNGTLGMFSGSAINTLIVGDNFIMNTNNSGWWTNTEKDLTLVIIHNGTVQEQLVNSSNKVPWMYSGSGNFKFGTIKVPYGMVSTYQQMWHLPTDVTYIEYEEGDY